MTEMNGASSYEAAEKQVQAVKIFRDMDSLQLVRYQDGYYIESRIGLRLYNSLRFRPSTLV